MFYIVPLLTLCFIIFALVDIITGPVSRIRHLDRGTWIMLVIFLPLIGSVLWFVIGREWEQAPENMRFGDPRRHEELGFESRTAGARSIEHELASIELEIEAHEKAARIRRLEAELEAKRLEKRES